MRPCGENVLLDLVRGGIGLAVGELFSLEDLARVSAAEAGWECLFVGRPLRPSGGIGAPINPLAIR